MEIRSTVNISFKGVAVQIALPSVDTTAMPPKGFESLRVPTLCRSTLLVGEHSLTLAGRRGHRKASDTWAAIHSLYGHLPFRSTDATPPRPVAAVDLFMTARQEPRHVEALGSMSLQIDFYDLQPSLPP